MPSVETIGTAGTRNPRSKSGRDARMIQTPAQTRMNANSVPMLVIVGEMTSIGTLFAFILVCAGVWIMRASRPDLERGFRVPAVPIVSTLGIIVCGAMIYGLGWTNWMRLLVWLVIGLVFYFSYGKQHSRINAPPPEMPEGIQLTR